MLTLKPKKAAMVLLAHTGWQAIQKGSLEIDSLELVPASPTEESEDYGFTCTADSGDKITGRLSALLAIRETPE